MKPTRLIRQLLRHYFRIEVSKVFPPPPPGIDALADLAAAEVEIIRAAEPYTMTGQARLASLLQAVTHVVNEGVEGGIAECGVWRGGSMFAVARMLIALGDTSRELFLYDTFEGMTPPTEKDLSFDGVTASSQLDSEPRNTGIWCYADLDDVRTNVLSTGYPPEKVHFIKGRVEETIPRTLPQKLALLRLDTDWYESTRHELRHLFPLLSANGVLIVDDYGHWQGARRAVDEYLGERNLHLYLHRIDYTGRIAIIPAEANRECGLR